MTTTTITTIDDLTPDDRNANKGTPRGQYMVQHSLERGDGLNRGEWLQYGSDHADLGRHAGQ